MGSDGRESAGGRWGGRGWGGEGGSGAAGGGGRTASVGGLNPPHDHDQWGGLTPLNHDQLASTTEDTMVTLGLVQ